MVLLAADGLAVLNECILLYRYSLPRLKADVTLARNIPRMLEAAALYSFPILFPIGRGSLLFHLIRRGVPSAEKRALPV